MGCGRDGLVLGGGLAYFKMNNVLIDDRHVQIGRAHV